MWKGYFEINCVKLGVCCGDFLCDDWDFVISV